MNGSAIGGALGLLFELALGILSLVILCSWNLKTPRKSSLMKNINVGHKYIMVRLTCGDESNQSLVIVDCDTKMINSNLVFGVELG